MAFEQFIRGGCQIIQISVSLTGQIRFSHKVAQVFNLGNHAGVDVYIDEVANSVAFEFTKEKKGERTLSKHWMNGSHLITCKSLVQHMGLNFNNGCVVLEGRIETILDKQMLVVDLPKTMIKERKR